VPGSVFLVRRSLRTFPVNTISIKKQIEEEVSNEIHPNTPFLFLTTLCFGFARNASAQCWDWNAEASIGQLRSFDSFLQNHPSIGKKLWEKPQRVNDSGFLKHNKELKQWLEDHPGAARAFQGDPIDLMARERHFQIYGGDFVGGNVRRAELARFGWFLDSHRDIRHDLTRRPELVDRREYLVRHPELGDFLYHHPALRDELQERPREFMDREARYEHEM
jgi:hypothetical protein